MDKTALFTISHGVYIVGVRSEPGFSGCTVDAVAQVSAGNRQIITLSCLNTTLTRELIESTREFSLSVLTRGIDPYVIGNFGYCSGRDADKWSRVEYQLLSGLPVIKNSAAVMLANVLSSFVYDDHTLFVCEVTEAEKGLSTDEILTYGYYQSDLKAKVAAAFYGETARNTASVRRQCKVCGYVYDGDIPFGDLPGDYRCPVCGVGREYFEQT